MQLNLNNYSWQILKYKNKHICLYNFLMSQQPFQVPMEVQSCIVQWIGLISKRNFLHYQKNIESIKDIVNSNFYLNILANVQSFRLIERVNPHNQSDVNNTQLSYCVDNMKKIGKSVMAYYQTIKLANISNIKFNFVAQCMGNKQEIVHFFLVVLGILVDSPNHQRHFENLQCRMSQAGCINFKQCIQNSKRVGGQECFLSNRSFIKDSSNKKKLLNRLQELQENQDLLEEQNKKLRDQLNQCKQISQKLFNRVNQLETDILSLSQRKCQFEECYDQLSRSKSMMNRTEQTLRNKISQLQIQILQKDSKFKQQAIKVQQLSKKLEIYHNKNTDIKSINEDLRKLLDAQKHKNSKNSFRNQQLKKQNQKLHQQKEELLAFKLNAQRQLSKYREVAQQSNFRAKGKHPNCSVFQIDQSLSDNEDQHNKYRNKQNLASALNSSRLMVESEKINRHFTLAKQFQCQNRQIMQNFSIFNMSRYQKEMTQQDKSLNQKKTNAQCIYQPKSIQEFVTYLYKLNSQHKQQVMLLVQMIYDLQNQLFRQRMQQKEERQAKQKRIQRFKSKVSEMFGEKIR